MQTAAYESKQSIMQRIITVFVFTLLVATIGLYTGQFIPPALMLPLSVLEVVMIIAAFWLRRKKAVGYVFVFSFAFISGMTLFPITSHYASAAGAYVVLEAFGSSFVIFAVLGTIGAKTKKDLSFLWSFLLVAVIALLAVGIFNIFSPLNSAAMMAYSVIGTIVFSMYILYDLNQIKHRDITADLIPLMALTLYIDFINLFINLLRFFGILNSDD
ncbi:Bax inhibitor-1 family protein [Bacillus velezensis]|uniref:Bax inhibitor-1/YccA family protein n=1 Tax=Bacillus amyloliquefaciens group TaxID=1938374 RepID=UPI001374F83B|nr:MULTISPECIES: Bax inhibitor-1 family protein [Bacillus amyloliquefaciens group]MCT6832229.1 Bax inhibitor-1 family protein [Bacillus velezensis]MCT6865307.1 Bax inhibitor-1 family protein [Bacillus velezensis]QOX76227.1 Bax inhibitor-1 family protein [Bacillus velezensis]QVV94545.1 Bax inhibitor-1 family protein [Bacillus amyloliquefaciens]QYR14679.1 Bax inhibitor-1/YccA family protein [Bacillus velezensis]